MKTEESYNAMEKSIAPRHLQKVEIICKDVDGIVLKVLKVLNANGVPLEKIRIQCSGHKLSMNCHDSFVLRSATAT
jgi:predicted amino acid-binding ACT domain protein